MEKPCRVLCLALPGLRNGGKTVGVRRPADFTPPFPYSGAMLGPRCDVRTLSSFSAAYRSILKLNPESLSTNAPTAP